MVAATIAIAAFSIVLNQDYLYFAISMTVWASLANEIHALAHMLPKEKPWYGCFQGYLFQGGQEHHVHHTETDRNYCVMSPWLNGILNYTRFWRALEWGVEMVSGVPPRLDENVRQEAFESKARANSSGKKDQ